MFTPMLYFTKIAYTVGKFDGKSVGRRVGLSDGR